MGQNYFRKTQLSVYKRLAINSLLLIIKKAPSVEEAYHFNLLIIIKESVSFLLLE
ncbi:MAG: hypothetical protein RLZZ94_616 [Bacteroidota bacterium]